MYSILTVADGVGTVKQLGLGRPAMRWHDAKNLQEKSGLGSPTIGCNGTNDGRPTSNTGSYSSNNADDDDIG